MQAIVNGVVQAAFAGAVVDLHDGGQNRAETVAALPQIISDLEGEGYSFVSICGSAKLAVPQTSAVYSFAAAPVGWPGDHLQRTAGRRHDQPGEHGLLG